MRLMALAFALFALCLNGGRAEAQVCSFSMSNINFGNISIGPGGTPPSSGTFTANCTGAPGATITICPNLGDGTGGSTNGSPRYMLNGTARVPYDLLQANGQVWGSYVWPYGQRPPIFSLRLDGTGAGVLSQTVQAVISGSLSASPVGTYTSSFSGGHTLFDYGYAPAQSCSVQSNRVLRVPFSVQSTVAAACNLAISPMAFGTLSGLTTAQSATGQIGLTCTQNVNYTVSMNFGKNGGTGPAARKLASTGGSTITYGIYRDAAHTQPWGQTVGADTASGVGSGAQQNITAFGMIPAQGNPAPAAYADTVIVTVSY